MSAGFSLQATLIRRLLSISELIGVYDGPPPRAAYPYLVADCGTEQDWSTKDRVGREVAVALTLWDDQPARLQHVSDLIEATLNVDLIIPDWILASWRFLQRRTVRDVAGPWAISLEYRARLLAQVEERQ